MMVQSSILASARGTSPAFWGKVAAKSPRQLKLIHRTRRRLRCGPPPQRIEQLPLFLLRSIPPRAQEIWKNLVVDELVSHRSKLHELILQCMHTKNVVP